MKKVIAAVLLLVLAGVAAFYIKETVDANNPLYGIPQLSVTADTIEVEVELGGCDWRFRNGRRYVQETILHYYVEPPVVEVLGGEQLTIDLSLADPRILNVSRSDGPYSVNLVSTKGDLMVPFESGEYLYEVYAEYEQGFVVYYFRVKVL